jgi:hypothetical protein
MYLFGEIAGGVMRLNTCREIAAECQANIPVRYSGAEADKFIKIPNPIHEIAIINSPVGAIHELPL